MSTSPRCVGPIVHFLSNSFWENSHVNAIEPNICFLTRQARMLDIYFGRTVNASEPNMPDIQLIKNEMTIVSVRRRMNTFTRIVTTHKSCYKYKLFLISKKLKLNGRYFCSPESRVGSGSLYLINFHGIIN